MAATLNKQITKKTKNNHNSGMSIFFEDVVR